MNQDKLLKIDFSNVMADRVGSDHGISLSEFDVLSQKAKSIYQQCTDKFKAGSIGFMNLPGDIKALDGIEALARQHRNRWENLLVFGIGGSALGITMLANALCHPYHNHLSSELRSGSPRLFVLDNIDPDMISGLKSIIDPDETLINIITKSGGTIETWGNLFQYMTVFQSNPSADQVVAITDPENGFLRSYASVQNWQTLPVPTDVGGRFSVLTPVGLFAASVLNIDIYQLMAGAQFMHNQCLTDDIHNNPALKLAAIKFHLLTEKKKSISALMPYTNSLNSFADWYRQLWAESLGKASSLDGHTINTGQTPVKALGATDQHSQIQLYREGPNDKLVTFLTLEEFRFGGPMTDAPIDTPLENLRLLDTGEVLNIEYAGTRDALTDSQRPNLTISMPSLSPFHLGQLIYLYELTTYYAGAFLNIDPFDQPGVEAGKIIAKGLIQDIFDSRT